MESCAVVGPKPTRFKFGYKEENSLCRKIKKAMLRQFRRLYRKKGVQRFYIGGAIGVNLWAGELLLKLKEEPGYEDSNVSSASSAVPEAPSGRRRRPGSP